VHIKRPELQLNNCIIDDDSAAAHKALPVKKFLAKNQLLKWNTHSIGLMWL
jgi:hypothetical protein